MPGPILTFHENPPVQPMQTPSVPGRMTQGQYQQPAQFQPGQAPPGAMPPARDPQGSIPQAQPSHPPTSQPPMPANQVPPGQHPAGQGPQPYPTQQWTPAPDSQQYSQAPCNQAPCNQAAYNQAYAAPPAMAQQGYRPAQSQLSPPMAPPDSPQTRPMPSQTVAAQAATQNNMAIQNSPRGPLVPARNPGAPGGYGPTSPTQYLQREAAAQAAANAITNRYAQPYGNQQQPGQRQVPAGGPVGWTGRPPAQTTSFAPRSTIARRYRYPEDDDFVPRFGPTHQASESWSFSLPIINWHNWPIASMRFWTALGGVVFAAIMLNVLGTSPVISSIVKSRNRQCQEVVQQNSVLSRQQLTQLLTVPERSPKADIHSIIREPYCLLPSLNIRAGVNAIREAYPLEFDPDTWIVVLYEGDEYAGYRFNAR